MVKGGTTMQTETKAAKILQGTVKTVFIACYIAFMWASIHHIAAFYNGFEENSSNVIGSYMLAGAVDITALVTTIGVMFFRKSMPRWVFWIVWSFIVALALYSFFINWEYANHYQNMTLIMQPTGETTPVYDNQGLLHYVPVMQINTWLLWVNPVLASGFTIFSLIYSVIAEFFGTKAATMEELLAKKKYLEETAGVLEEIRKIEEKSKGTSIIDRLKKSALEVKSAVKEVIQSESTESEEEQSIRVDEAIQESFNEQSIQVEGSIQSDHQFELEDEVKEGENTDQDDKWGTFTGRSMVTLEKAAELLDVSINTIITLRNKKTLKTAALNRNLITVASLKAYDLKRSNRKQPRRTDDLKPHLKIVHE
jgi:hypothetical protein